MHVNPYAPPVQRSPAESRPTAHRTVRCCVGVASAIYAGWLTPIAYRAGLVYDIGGTQDLIDILNRSRTLLSAMLFAATVGGIATIAARNHRTWLAILLAWVPVAMYPVSLAMYTYWAQQWEWYGVLFLPAILLAVLASPFAYAREYTSRRSL